MSFKAVFSSDFWRIAAGVVLTTLFFASQSLLAAPPADSAGKVSRLIDLSGIGHVATQVLPGMLIGIDDPQPGVPAGIRSALRDAATQAFQADTMIERIRIRLGSALTGGQLDDALSWLDTPLGRRITSLENAASEPAAMAEMRAYAQELQQRPAPKHRADLISELNAATGASELTASIMEASVLATAFGFNAAQSVQQQVPADLLRQRVKSSLPQLRERLDQTVTLSLFYAYRSLSDQELAVYLNFLKSSSGAAYSKGAVEAFREAMLEAIGRFMLAIPKAMVKHKGTKGA